MRYSEVAVGVGAAEPIEPPAHWSAKDRETFSAQTPEAQALASIQQVVKKWGDYLNAVGAPSPFAVDKLLETEHALRTGNNATKLQVFKNLIRDYGIITPGQNEPMPDPEIAMLRQQIHEMQAGTLARQPPSSRRV